MNDKRSQALTPEEMVEIERRVRSTVCEFCKERRPGESACISDCPLRDYLQLPSNEIITLGNALDSRVEMALRILDNEWRERQTVEELAQRLNLSASRLKHLFKQEVGSSITKVVKMRRLTVAARLLITTGMRISEISAYVGFDDLTSFERSFRSYHGMPPKQFRSQATREGS